MKGCRSAAFGCLDCKKPLIDAIIAEQEVIITRAKEFEDSPRLVRNIINEGCDQAREVARETLVDVRKAMGLSYR